MKNMLNFILYQELLYELLQDGGKRSQCPFYFTKTAGSPKSIMGTISVYQDDEVHVKDLPFANTMCPAESNENTGKLHI